MPNPLTASHILAMCQKLSQLGWQSSCWRNQCWECQVQLRSRLMLNQHQLASETQPLLSSNYFMSKPIFYKVFSVIFGAIKIFEKLWRWGIFIQRGQSFETYDSCKLGSVHVFQQPHIGWLTLMLGHRLIICYYDEYYKHTM